MERMKKMRQRTKEGKNMIEEIISLMKERQHHMRALGRKEAGIRSRRIREQWNKLSLLPNEMK